MAKIAHLIRVDPGGGSHPKGTRICNVCNATFAQIKSIEDHIEAVHVKIPVYECNFCSETFTYRGAKHNHVSKYHREQNKMKNIPHY